MRNMAVTYYRELRISLIRFKAVMKVPSALAIVTIVFVSVATETLTDTFDSLHDRLILMAGLGVLVVIFFKKWEIPFRREAATFGQVDDDKLVHRKGLIVLVGLESAKLGRAAAPLFQSARSAEIIAFVGTPEVRAKGIFEELSERLMPAAGLNIPSQKIKTLDRGNALVISDFYEQTNEAINWMLSKGYQPSEIVVDISEGRRAMYFGAEQAARALSVEVQYWGAIWDPIQTVRIEGSKAFKVISEIY